MENDEIKTTKWQSLRADAEDKLSQLPGASSEMKEKTLEGLIHELQVHQIELEMQNDELRKAQLALEDTRDKYIDLYDFAPVGYFTFTREALIKEVNLTGASLLGIERQKLINGRFRRFVAPNFLEQWDRYLINVFEKGEKLSCDLELIRLDGSEFYARFESSRIEEKGGNFVVRTALSDITAHKKAEKALHQYSDEIDRKNKEFQEALDRVKTLSGLLSICSICKKIRNEKGKWENLEAYISDHSEALLSHGMCPDCIKQFYSEYFKKDE